MKKTKRKKPLPHLISKLLLLILNSSQNLPKTAIKHLKKNFPSIKLTFLLLILITISTTISHQTKSTLEASSTYKENQQIPLNTKHPLLQQNPTTTPHPYSLSLLDTTPTPKPLNHPIQVPILIYHYIEYVQDKNDQLRQDLNTNPDIFEQQVKTLADSGYTFMTTKELGEVFDGKEKLPDKPIILTFDDGHPDLVTDVLPILQKYNATATAYIIPGFIGKSDFLSSDQLKELINSGLIEIGAHTVTHIPLKNKLHHLVQYEITESKTILEKNYNIEVFSFAYPYGSFDPQATNIAKKAGFTTATSTLPGIEQSQENKFFLYRLRPGHKTGQELLNLLNQKPS